MNSKEKTRSAISKLRTAYESSPEANMMFAVLSLAIDDLSDNNVYRKRVKREGSPAVIINYKKDEYISACKYLNRIEIPHAEIIGIDSNYVRRVIKSLSISTAIAPTAQTS